MKVLETERLILRRMTVKDAEFVKELLNEPPFIKNIGDRGVRTTTDALAYILNGPVAMYEQYGFGLYVVELKESGEPIGICGLLKRETMEDVDIGFAFLEKHWRRGYAFESAGAVMEYGRKVIGLKRIVAITSPDNEDSRRVLEKIGFRFEKMIQMKGQNEDTKLFGCNFPQ